MNEKKFEKEILVCYLNVSNPKWGGAFLDGEGGLEILKKWLRLVTEGRGGGISDFFVVT